ncbi:DUF4239 domain-containing protein [Beijerinckia indica]|uniref:DUF4239 domain-containing protein n=1 Tax=Beijerinckia indica subsp. indica (strain ATCC 9039 / DSM 1715 / NCIMB 8712) TaxID=395963 RepID=B2IDQ7_BEII9|nr:DUF4239 domain-containing protein [Beijerinckia indica]ACB95491.1 conserved hypothetical protein [Beijerinckia indica subsp. indica ATCC 9039]
MIDFSAYSLGSIFAASLIVLLIACELGHHFGLRSKEEGQISTLEASMLGLLALMISFTFSMSLTRFDARREAVLMEANAIGTAALRARLLPESHATQSLKLLREYVQIRLDITAQEKYTPPAQLDGAIARSNAIQAALWAQVKPVIAKDNAMVPTGLYIQGLNEMFDAQEKRLTALRNRVPNIVFLGLYGIATVAIGFMGYASSATEKRWRIPAYIMIFLVAAVILLIEDIDRPGVGFVSVSQQPMRDTADALASYSTEIDGSVPQQ